MRIEILDHGYIELVESWGSDERIIEAARMSTNKGFQGWGPNNCSCFGEGDTQNYLNCPKCKGTGNIPGDEKLLRYLYEHKHATPFEMAGLIIEVQAPIFVFREWHRHRTQSYNEMSARYTQMPNLHYIPSRERLLLAGQDTRNKQGSLAIDLSEEDINQIRERIRATQQKIYEEYEILLATYGLSKEIARLNTPVSRYSRMRASANLRNWLAFLTLRMDQNAQWEIRQYANAIGSIIESLFPRTWELFIEGMNR